jgi:TonB family protein
MKTAGRVFQNWGMGSSIATSAAVHAALLLGALVGWHMANPASFPVDAIEIAVGDFMIQAGVSKAPQIAKAAPTPAVVSPVDLNVEKQKQEEADPEPVAQEVQTPQGPIGQGGQTAASSGRPLTEWDAYRMRLREKIHEALVYPRASKNLGETGQVTVKVSVLRDGTISDIKIAAPSAYERLNAAAVDTVKRVAHLDPFPPSYDSPQYSALVPIDFSLR